MHNVNYIEILKAYLWHVAVQELLSLGRTLPVGDTPVIFVHN